MMASMNDEFLDFWRFPKKQYWSIYYGNLEGDFSWHLDEEEGKSVDL